MRPDRVGVDDRGAAAREVQRDLVNVVSADTVLVRQLDDGVDARLKKRATSVPFELRFGDSVAAAKTLGQDLGRGALIPERAKETTSTFERTGWATETCVCQER